VKNLFAERNIPLTNIIGFASDNCSTMMGVRNGFQAHLKRDIPSVFVLGCICHSFALCANHASNCLPSWLENFVKNVCCYFARSSKRKHAFRMIQNVVGAQEHRILKLAQTRWLSRQQVISRILEQWDALQLFFQSEAPADKVDDAGGIYEMMVTPGVKHMLLFVNYVLSKVDKMNVEFQSEHFRLHKIFSNISDEYRNLMSMFIRNDVMQSNDLSEIDPLNQEFHKKLGDVDVGGRCENMLAKQSLGEKESRFRKDALSFLKELCAQIRKRFPLQRNSVLAQLRILDVEEALKHEGRLKSIVGLASQFSTLISEEELDALQDEWNMLPNAKESLGCMVDLMPQEFWFKLRSIKDGNNQLKFGRLSNFMCCLMALPHSSACVERIFSQVNMVKTVHTNKLHAETVAGRLLAKQAIAREGVDCHAWTPSKSLVEEVAKGRCHQRYIERHNNIKMRATPTLVMLAPNEEEDVYDVI